MRAIYPGSFDPLTLGHLDIIERAAKIFDEVLILISENTEKSARISLDQRIRLIEEACKSMSNIKTSSNSGLTVAYAKEHGYDCLIRGMRAASDFEGELELSQINHALSDGLETVFLMTDPKHSFIRASRVWELLKYDGDISLMVPENVALYINTNYR
ncbi:MAG: pantetheine-phosphate adenylyltransferase [Candidatus Melainabacteria bacterium]|nr:pantetheine-phosphate adenylyltransferase [Candidatus Melainabacteria bacterium]